MVRRTLSVAGWVLMAVFSISSCGGMSPTQPVAITPAPLPAPTPTPAPTPVPNPTPTPCSLGECEPPVVNTSPVTSVELRLYFIQDPAGDIVSWSAGPWPVGYLLRFDVVGRDRFNRETMGDKGSNPIFYYNDATLIAVVDANHDFQRKVKVLKPGNFQTWVNFDGVVSNVVGVTFIP